MTNPNIFFSFIIPVYNNAEYIENCVNSILSQNVSLEIILVDDSSTDSTLDILKRLAGADNRITIVEHKLNSSAHCSRIDGVIKSKGKYIWFVDGDDDIVDGACLEIENFLKQKPVDILHFGTNIVNDGNLPVTRVEAMQRFVEPFNSMLSGKKIFETCFIDNKYRFNIWNKIFDADLCKKAVQHMDYICLPKAQDMYEYYVISHYARSYVGLPDNKYYNYHFGRGITGHNSLSPVSFKRYCDMALSYESILNFSKKTNIHHKYETQISNLKTQLFNDCMSNWRKNVSLQDKGVCFDYMVDSWGILDVVSELANKDWYNQGQVAEYILQSKKMIISKSNVKTIATFYHTYANGGVQRVLAGLMKIWINAGYNVILITDEPPTDNDYYMPDGIKRVVIPSTSEITRETYNIRAKALIRILKENNVDVMVYHAWVSNILLWDLIICKLAGVAFTVHCHNIFSMLARNSRVYLASLPTIYRLCDCIVTLSDVDRTFWSNFNKNVNEVFNPLTFDVKNIPQSSLDSNTVLWIGRMSDEKRPRDAIKIMKEVVSVVPDAKLMMVGGGNQKIMNSIYELIDELEMRDSVIMNGFMLDVFPAYQQCSVLLCTSEYEGFLLTLTEAQSAGVPCVMYDLPYLTLTRKNLGLVQVPQLDVHAAANEIIRMLLDCQYRKKMGHDARSCIMKYQDYDYSGVWDKIFDSLSKPNVPMYENDANKIMWDTLMLHYKTGALRNNIKINNLMKNSSGEQSASVGSIVDNYENEIKKIKNSMTYRIGELITYLPKYIRGDFKK